MKVILVLFIFKGFDKHAGWKYRNETIRKRLFKQFYYNDNSYPRYGPENNIYTVYNDINKDLSKSQLYIKYTVKNNWLRDDDENYRGKGFSFAINRDDDFIINYDAINEKDLETLEFYMYTRIGREDYLTYIPILMEIYKTRKAELEKEKEFIKLILSQNKLDDNIENNKKVLELIDWWKLKNKWKRSLDVDNTKALRMISKELKK